MEIKTLLKGLDPYQQKAKVDKAENSSKGRQSDATDRASGDTVSLSNEAKLRTEAYRSAMSAPDIRREKVEALKAKVQSGEYEIDTKVVAEKLLKEEFELFSS